MNFKKMPKGLTAIATAAALVAGATIAYAQNNPPAQPTYNPTGQSGAALGNTQSGTTMDNSGTTMNNAGTTGSTGTTMDNSGTAAAQSDVVSPEPRADRN